MKHITDVRGIIKFLQQQNALYSIKGEVDPVYEIAGIQKALDNGPAFLFDNIKGYPAARNIGNIFSREETMSAMFGEPDFRKLKFKCLEAIKNPLPAKTVVDPPCQEVVITKDIDVPAILPSLKHSEDDAGHILGGGITLGWGLGEAKGNDLAFKRMHFRGKDWASLYIGRASHLGHAMFVEHKGKGMPLTINIGAPPSVMMVAATFFIPSVVTYGSDELGIAGRLQGSPVEICKAKTVDTYALANAEYVIEGHCLPDKVWETEESEKTAESRIAPLFPEWSGYLGRAMKVFKFQVTAVTHRKDRPIFYTPLAHSFEEENMCKPFREACYYDLAQRFTPGLVVDTNILHGFKVQSGVVYQVKKRNSTDDSFVKNLLEITLASSLAQIVVAVDSDVDIYNADEVLWAMVTRTHPETGLMKAPRGTVGMGLWPMDDTDKRGGGGHGRGGIAFDATSPYAIRKLFKRAHYPVDKIDLRKWFSDEEITAVRARQCEYARVLARIGG